MPRKEQQRKVHFSKIFPNNPLRNMHGGLAEARAYCTKLELAYGDVDLLDWTHFSDFTGPLA